nr:hypothetical protein BaRGS_022297 [Batillaria attramentaria]
MLTPEFSRPDFMYLFKSFNLDCLHLVRYITWRVRYITWRVLYITWRVLYITWRVRYITWRSLEEARTKKDLKDQHSFYKA